MNPGLSLTKTYFLAIKACSTGFPSHWLRFIGQNLPGDICLSYSYYGIISLQEYYKEHCQLNCRNPMIKYLWHALISTITIILSKTFLKNKVSLACIILTKFILFSPFTFLQIPFIYSFVQLVHIENLLCATNPIVDTAVKRQHSISSHSLPLGNLHSFFLMIVPKNFRKSTSSWLAYSF